jgi:glycosyltransferase involved in cell wall biosynthesis
MRIAYLTAGAAGMYCGSCMHDNALARALSARGHDCLLLPVYTPIRTDEADVSAGQIFFGGVNVYLQQKWPTLGRLPRPLLRWLDRPGLLRLLTRRAGGTDPALLGELTVSMLRGTHGHQAGEARRLIAWLRDEFRPDLIVMTNLLIGGCIPELKAETGAPVLVWLQGDDIFLDHLPDGSRQTATKLMSELAAQCDGCLVNSRFYADKMGRRLGIDANQFHILPLAIDATPFPRREVPAQGSRSQGSPLRLGYFARLAPEKGFHNIVEAFIELSRQMGPGNVELHYGGWLGHQHKAYFAAQQQRLNEAGLAAHHRHCGSPDLAAKVAFLKTLDLFSVPTDYEECKGLYVLEALASGVPVVQPNHGAFPELIESTGGGMLYPASDGAAFAAALRELLSEDAKRQQIGGTACERVREVHSITAQAAQLLELPVCGRAQA